MDTLATAKRLERRVGLGSPARLKGFAIALTVLLAIVTEMAHALLFQRYRHLIPGHAVEWATFLFIPVFPLLGVLSTFWQAKRVEAKGTLSTDAADLLARTVMAWVTVVYVGMFFVSNLLWAALHG